MRCTEWWPRDAAGQFGSRGAAAIGDLNRLGPDRIYSHP